MPSWTPCLYSRGAPGMSWSPEGRQASLIGKENLTSSGVPTGLGVTLMMVRTSEPDGEASSPPQPASPREMRSIPAKRTDERIRPAFLLPFAASETRGRVLRIPAAERSGNPRRRHAGRGRARCSPMRTTDLESLYGRAEATRMAAAWASSSRRSSRGVSSTSPWRRWRASRSRWSAKRGFLGRREPWR